MKTQGERWENLAWDQGSRVPSKRHFIGLPQPELGLDVNPFGKPNCRLQCRPSHVTLFFIGCLAPDQPCGWSFHDALTRNRAQETILTSLKCYSNMSGICGQWLVIQNQNMVQLCWGACRASAIHNLRFIYKTSQSLRTNSNLHSNCSSTLSSSFRIRG